MPVIYQARRAASSPARLSAMRSIVAAPSKARSDSIITLPPSIVTAKFSPLTVKYHASSKRDAVRQSRA
ncbi:hypothetical protein FJ987_15290 [Mesorhizobium sp. CU2]|uniref:hypothetical protein n=1 Tax=unclassified Mesorhizobium TaxID=325217 RepID=UPI0011288AF4|nr:MULTISPECIES: hypothetical protein [unclassified Mesorhizobium]TPN89650.1 hypothetical protein FJ988_01665 [Mesorhizobium sp. CU3]TPO13915.1 hypothetical protein FJ987_15290 [Mesorhizobium sp. CU2]